MHELSEQQMRIVQHSIVEYQIYKSSIKNKRTSSEDVVRFSEVQ